MVRAPSIALPAPDVGWTDGADVARGWGGEFCNGETSGLVNKGRMAEGHGESWNVGGGGVIGRRMGVRRYG